MVTHAILPDAVFDTRLALFLTTTRTLVVADLHWGYAESHRTTGNLFPAWGDDQLETTLRALLADHAPAEFIWLGDSLHTTRAAPHARARAEAFIATSPIPVHVIAGNHDSRWPLASPTPLTRDRFLLHHGDRPLPTPDPLPTPAPAPASDIRHSSFDIGHSSTPPLRGAVEVIGHHHPAYLHRDGAGTRLKLPALVQTPGRLILPAFSPWAAGVAWNDRLSPADTLWAATPRRLLPVRPPG